MHFLERRAEDKIREAMEQGVFDELPLAGQPFRRESSSHVPEELRIAYKLLKNSGFLPPELEWRKEVLRLRDLLATIDDDDDDERCRLARELNERVLKLNLMLKRSFAHEDQQVYGGKLRAKMVRSK